MLLDKSNLVKYDRKTGYWIRSFLHYTYRIVLYIRTFWWIQVYPRLWRGKLELSKLLERVPVPVKEGIEEPTSKINVLFNGEVILYHGSFILKQKYAEEDHVIIFTISLFNPLPPNYFISILTGETRRNKTFVYLKVENYICWQWCWTNIQNYCFTNECVTLLIKQRIKFVLYV